MLGIQLILIAGLFVAGSNFCMRRSIDAGGTTKAFLMIQLFIVFLVAILLNPVRSGNFEWSSSMAVFGFAGGLILAFMMASLGKALESGPPGLTFAALNASTVMPSMMMALFFGGAFGYIYTLWNGVGSLLVVIGLFWAGWQAAKSEQKANWVAFVAGAFLLHVLFLIFLSWRALFIHFPNAEDLLFSFTPQDMETQWFMPMVFLAAFVVQSFIFAKAERRFPNQKEAIYGVSGGIANGIGTFFMIRATEVATPLEHAMIYPVFSIAIILLCNMWGKWLYQEQVNWKANAVCVIGILVGTLDWKVLFA